MEKYCLVTGANTGIGKATAMGLAAEGQHVIMACRNHDKGHRARTEIIAQTGNGHIDLLELDLAVPRSVRNFAAKIAAGYQRIDVLINNAGLSLQDRRETEQGLEMTMAVNHLGTFMLTMLLLDLLKKSAPARIVTVASSVHKQASLDLDDFNLKQDWDGYRAYANSKLCNIYFTHTLSEKLQGSKVTANCLGPGLVNSEFFRNYGKLPLGFRIIQKLIGRTPEKGARTSLYLALSPEVEGVSGKYFSDCKPQKTSDASYDKKTADRLWEMSLKLCGL